MWFGKVAPGLSFFQILDEIEEHNIKIYHLPDAESDEDEDFKEQTRLLKVRAVAGYPAPVTCCCHQHRRKSWQRSHLGRLAFERSSGRFSYNRIFAKNIFGHSCPLRFRNRITCLICFHILVSMQKIPVTS